VASPSTWSSPAEPREMEDVARGAAPGPLRPGVPVSIIGAEDEDFENELEANSEEQNSQFQSLEQVKRRPAHLMALLQHVALQFEPGPLVRAGLGGHREGWAWDRHSTQKERQLQDQRLVLLTPKRQKLQSFPHLHSLPEEWLPNTLAVSSYSAAVVNAIGLYMRYLGVRTKSGDKKSGRNFFRKKVMGNRRSDEPAKTKKGLSSILDAARWNRGEPQDFRHLKVEVDAEKPGATDRKGGPGVYSRDRNVGAPGQDTPGLSLHLLSLDSPDREPGAEAPLELGDSSPQGPMSLEPPAPLESTDEGAETESPEPGDDGEPGRSGLELEPEEPPGWRELIPPDTLHRLPKSQVKRQEVISELLVTEAAHVRMLRVLHDLFYQPMAEGGFFPLEELQNIFPSLDELIEVHSLFLDRLMKRRQESGYLIEEIGDVLLARFDGAEGSWFQKISSRFCSRQSFALEQLKAKQRKEPRFCAFVQEAESRPRCRRLQLKDMIPTEMQRLTKYPLLLQSIGQNTEESTEREKVELAAECCREILHHVNQAVRDMEDLLRLKDYQRRLDLSHLRQSSDPMLSEFKNLDITKKKLVHEGPLTWRVTKDKAVEVHVLLLDDLLLLLQRQDERLLLKSHSRTLTPTPDGKTMLRPVLRLTSAMTREVATDHKAFYVIFTWDQEAQIYELVAQTVSERKNWCALITETAGSLKVPAPASRPKPRPSPNSTREPLLSSSENGNGGRETSQADARTERILSDLLPFCRPGPEGQLAATALRKGAGGGILPPATPPVSAWGELCPPAWWLYLRSLPRKAFFKKERNWGEDMRDHPHPYSCGSISHPEGLRRGSFRPRLGGAQLGLLARHGPWSSLPPALCLGDSGLHSRGHRGDPGHLSICLCSVFIC
uniref:Rho guanine nucleotide exchange factor 1 n=1 Tax=Saimiri boliviensis boliviensis TaxID=39432 RepID=A0A2K6UW93_SAIBB